MDNVLINFVGETEGLDPLLGTLESIIVKNSEVGETWKKASEGIDKNSKKSADVTGKLAKSLDALNVATKTLDKTVIGGAYTTYLKNLQTQLGLTNAELIKYIQTKRLIAANAAADELGDPSMTTQEFAELLVSIEAMNKALLDLGATEETTTEKTASMKTQLRQMKEQLSQMDEGTPEFEALRIKAGQLDDKIKDLNKSVASIGSDTNKIDGLISLASGVAAGFAVAKGVSALFGEESEDVQKALVKLNAAMAILQGLQTLQNVLQKESAASLLLQSASTDRATASTQKLAVATGASNAAFRANPVGLVITAILGLITVYSILTGETEDNTEAIKRNIDALNTQLDTIDRIRELQKLGYNDPLNSNVNTLTIELELLEKQGASTAQLLAKRKELAYATALNNQENATAIRKEEEDRLRNYKMMKDGQISNALDVKGQGVALFALINMEIAGRNRINELKRDGRELTKKEEKELEVLNEQVDNYAKRIERLNKASNDSYAANRELVKARLEQEKFARDQAIKNMVAGAELELAQARRVILAKDIDSGKALERQRVAEIGVITARRDAELKNLDLTENERKKITAQANLAIAEVNKANAVRVLEVRKKGIDAELSLTRKGTKAEYDAKINSIDAAQKIELAAEVLTQTEVDAIKTKFDLERRAALRAFNEAQLNDAISNINAQLDAFDVSEDKKLEYTLARLQKQKELEIIAAEENGAKIVEINAKYDKQIREAKIASIDAIRAKELAAYQAYTAAVVKIDEKVANSEASSPKRKIAALRRLADQKQAELQIEIAAQEKKKGLDDQYEVHYQELMNRKRQIAQDTEEKITEVEIGEIDVRLGKLKTVFDFINKGFDGLATDSPLSNALKEITTFGTAVYGIFAKLKVQVASYNAVIAAGAKDTATAADKAAAQQATEDKKAAKTAATRQGEIALISATQSVVNSIYAASAARREAELNREIELLNSAKEKELAAENLTVQQRENIQERYRQRELRIKRQAFEADKAAKRSQALINGALAFTLALASYAYPYNLVVAGIGAALTAIEIGEINRQKFPGFKKGKVNIDGPGTATSDSINARLSKGESVVTAEATAKWSHALEAMNNMSFDQYLNDIISAFVQPQIPAAVTVTGRGIEFDYDKLGESIAAKIPAAMSFNATIDENGLKSWVQQGSNTTEFVNKRYSMSNG